MVEEGQGV